VPESAKNRIFEVDPLGQHVPPRVRYEMTCLLIRIVSCSVGWGMASYFVIYFVNHLSHMVQEGTFVRETIALQAGPFVRETIAKHDILL
jgi:hypothetical protein